MPTRIGASEGSTARWRRAMHDDAHMATVRESLGEGDRAAGDPRPVGEVPDVAVVPAEPGITRAVAEYEVDVLGDIAGERAALAAQRPVVTERPDAVINLDRPRLGD